MKETKIPASEQRIMAKLTDIGNTVNKIDTRLVVVEKKVDGLDTRLTQVETELTYITKRLTTVEKTVDTIVVRLVNVEEKVENMVTKEEFSEFKDDYYRGQDEVVKKLDKLDQEQTFTVLRQSRSEKEISKIKLHLAIA